MYHTHGTIHRTQLTAAALGEAEQEEGVQPALLDAALLFFCLHLKKSHWNNQFVVAQHTQ